MVHAPGHMTDSSCVVLSKAARVHTSYCDVCFLQVVMFSCTAKLYLQILKGGTVASGHIDL
jgi:hypothetical protein